VAEPRLPEDPSEGFPVVGQRSLSGQRLDNGRRAEGYMFRMVLYEVGSKEMYSLRAKIIMGSVD
jgi:hypothetical protein